MNIKKHRITAAAGMILFAAAVFVIIACNRSDQATADYSGFAMDTVVSVKLYGGKNPDQLLQEVNRLFLYTEERISRHIEGSDISRLNAGETLETDGFLIDLLEKNLEIWQETDGLFNPAAGPLIDLWAIGSGKECIPEESSIQKAMEAVSGSRIRISGNTVSVKPGTILDLGASGKGLVLQQIYNLLKETDLKGALVNAGGSLLLYGTHDGKVTYQIAVQNPDPEASEYLGILTLSDCFVSTSGDYERYFILDGKRYHHILSPETGYPAETGLRSVTVVTDDGTMSDILSTAVFLLGKERGLQLLSVHHAEGILASEDGTVTVTAGLQDRFSLTADGYTLEVYEEIHKTR